MDVPVQRLVRWVLATLGALALLAFGTVVFFTRTHPGQRLVLGEALERLRGAIAGEVRVADVSSRGLLGEVVLHGVRIADREGRPFLLADSLRARYGLLTLLSGGSVLTELSVWGGEVTVERLPGEKEWNVSRIFAPLLRPEPTAPREGAPRRIVLHDVRLYGTGVAVRMPLEVGERPDPRELVEPAPGGGGWLRVFRFAGIELVAPEVVVRDPRRPGRRVRLEELALTGRIWGEAFRIERARGVVEIRDTSIAFDLEELRLPGSRAAVQGSAAWGDTGLELDVDFTAHEVAFADLRWAAPRLPEGRGRLAGRLHRDRNGVRFMARGVDLTVGTSRVRGEFGAAMGRDLRLEGVALTLDPLELGVLARLLGRPLPVSGAVRGKVRADGSLRALAVQGRLTLQPGDGAGASTVEGHGTLHLEPPYGATELWAVLAPLDLGSLAALDPRMKLRGPGSARITVTGRLDRGLRFGMLFAHTPRELPPSRIEAEGEVRREAGDLVLAVDARAEPLSLTALAHFYPELALGGEVRGRIRLEGRLGDLGAAVRFETPAGPLALDARFDARDPGRRYVVSGVLDRFRLSEFSPRLSATTLTGRFQVEGSGTSKNSLRGRALAVLGRSRIEGIGVDTAHVAVRVEDGLAVVDTAFAVTRVASLEAGGSLALADNHAGTGGLHVQVATDSLGNLAPFLFGHSAILQDTLSRMERRALEMRGVDPDTLARGEGHRIGGGLRAELTLVGSVTEFAADGRAELWSAHYGRDSVRHAVVRFRASSLPALQGPVSLQVEADSVRLYGRNFRQVTAELGYRRPGGSVAALLVRQGGDEVRVRGDFEVDAAGFSVELSELSFRFGEEVWALARPALLVRGEHGFRVRGFEIAGPGEPRVRIAAAGILPSRGAADFRLDVEALPLSRIARLVQLEGRGIAGVVNAHLDVAGSAGAPAMEASLAARELRYQGVVLSSLEGSFRYAGRRLSGGLDAWIGGRKVFTAAGTVPLDLAFVDVADRTPAEPVDVTITVDSFPAATVLSFFEEFQDVTGVFGGRLRVGGQPDSLEFEGEVRLAEGGARLEALGPRYSDAEGVFRLSPDRRLHVNAEVRSRGLARVAGIVALDRLDDPAFDLDISATGFQGVDRPDMTAVVGGRVTLRGSYRRPVVTGSMEVEGGVLWLREFERGLEVVDLSDPALFSVVDTALVSEPAVIAESQNPFLQNLRVDVDLAVRHDTWLRSPEMNVEITGDLAVSYDRTNRRLALVGELRAARGSYTAFGRHFRVAGGTIEFVGSPDVNPNLDIQAVYRLRGAEGEPLTITATLGGTLREPRLTLTSDAQPPISQSDLVSYLLFGRPTYALASGESTLLGQRVSSSLLGAAAEAAVSTGLGAAASQIEALLVQDLGIDYFSITPAVDPVGTAPQDARASALRSQVELGQYIAQDVFLVLLYRLGALSQTPFPGARIEWRFADFWTAEAFAEDRFSREPLSGFSELAFRLSKVYGIFVYRDWGY